MINIAIDGPSGAGKSTIAKSVANELGFIYIDTGAMYRTIGLAASRRGINSKDDKEAVVGILDDIMIDIGHQNGVQHVYLNGEDVSDKIRTPEISLAASYVAVIPEVREKMVEFQRALSENHDCIMDGRDIGTCVLPDADVKIFLTADVEARAERRYKELLLKGESVTYQAVLDDMIFRDKNDSSRECMPLKKADDAILIDTTKLNLQESINVVKDTVNRVLKERM